MRNPINISGMQMANQAIGLLLVWDGATPMAPVARVPATATSIFSWRHFDFNPCQMKSGCHFFAARSPTCVKGWAVQRHTPKPDRVQGGMRPTDKPIYPRTGRSGLRLGAYKGR